MPVGLKREVRILALVLALLFSSEFAQAQLKYQSFSTDQIQKCPASGKAKPPEAQRVNINGLPFSGAPWLKASFLLPQTPQKLRSASLSFDNQRHSRTIPFLRDILHTDLLNSI